MRYLEGEERRIADEIYKEAIAEAKRARCAKSKRGVVFARGLTIVGRGCNGPPEGYVCNPAFCMAHCAQYAVHAEEKALYDIKQRGEKISGVRGYHVKVDRDGNPLPSSVPSCIHCSKDMMAAGVAEFVLQDEHGYVLYDIVEFHDLTIQNRFGKEFFEAVKDPGSRD